MLSQVEIVGAFLALHGRDQVASRIARIPSASVLHLLVELKCVECYSILQTVVLQSVFVRADDALELLGAHGASARRFM
jgi:hypothetical protein